MDGLGIAAIIGAVGVVITSTAAAYVSIRNTRTINDTHAKVSQIDVAVNGKEPGEQTLVSQVDDLHHEIPGAKGSNGDLIEPNGVLPLLRRIDEHVSRNTKRIEELERRGLDEDPKP